MTYAIAGSTFARQPTAGRWLPRQRLSFSGTGHGVYTGVREFEIRWQLVTPSDFNEIQAFFDAIGTTGTSVVSLPKYGSATYEFFDYTGCVIQEPEVNRYLTEHQQEVVLLITNIRT